MIVMLRRALARAAFGLVGAFLATPAYAIDTVAIDAAVTFQRMDGFGISSRVFDDPHLFNNFDPATGRAVTVLTPSQQDAILDRLLPTREYSR